MITRSVNFVSCSALNRSSHCPLEAIVAAELDDNEICLYGQVSNMKDIGDGDIGVGKSGRNPIINNLVQVNQTTGDNRGDHFGATKPIGMYFRTHREEETQTHITKSPTQVCIGWQLD
ncbi:unnamed protein product [Protopolystoma xenopodis]|uniref:Uncharacterized protein n=1 Tax=Protopolystoma xenopodis TaxID=117903 RepID=A0A448WTZ9_9PLAT|nr:unnamed protein product [Protopolystoma xenopodis]